MPASIPAPKAQTAKTTTKTTEAIQKLVKRTTPRKVKVKPHTPPRLMFKDFASI